ncbi:MAG: protein kinase [Terracidiphilus sp.]
MVKTQPRRVRFGAFELDLDTGELSGSGPTVQLAEKPLRILTTLIEHGGQLVTRETLQERLWPNDTVVDFEHGINTAIKVLRRALGDSADSPGYVETVPRRGYRLMVPAEWIDGAIDRGVPGARADTQPPAVRTGGMTGKVVSHYRVLNLIGGGGMGVVYRAEDLKLGRTVALKFLSEELGGDPAALERFHREARAISILDHPNICPIYEFGEHAGLPFLVMPLLQGQILRDRLADSVARPRAFPLEELIGVGIDISAGLQAAHEKGIIHRDIKPANIFLTDHGHAKILDFGVAKVAQAPAAQDRSVDSAAKPFAPNGSDLTSPRSCLGTYPYMSPEQAAGKELDARTDLFSFGVVLCEMATGTLAFDGGPAGIFKAVAEGTPVTLNLANSYAKPELERIIRKALEVDRALRYQAAAEMRADLSRLKRDSGQLILAPAPASVPEWMLQKPWLRFLLPVVFALLLVAGTFFYLRARHAATPLRASWVQLTNFPDGATQPEFSPDGRMLAFIRGPETFVTPGQIYVKMLPDGKPIQLTHDDSPKMAPAFSPDGLRIAYTATDASFGWNTWVVPVLGGEPKELLPNAAALTWTNPQHVVFSEVKTGTYMGVVTASESRSGERNVYWPTWWGMAHRSWVSPDSKWILISEMDNASWRPCRVVPFDGSTMGRIVGPPKARCTNADWSPDGRTMYFSADAGDGYHIWRQKFPGGAPEQLTFGPTEEEGISVSPDGHSLVTSAGMQESTVWVHDERGDRQISGEGWAGVPGMGVGDSWAHSIFSSDGRKLFYLDSQEGTHGLRGFESGELLATDLDSGQTEAVLPGVQISEFDIDPDGRTVAYATLDSEGVSHVWEASIDRHLPPKQLTQSAAQRPCFRGAGEIYFLEVDGAQNIAYGIGPGDAAPHKVTPPLQSSCGGISPRGDLSLNGFGNIQANPRDGVNPIRVCSSCGASWDSGGKFFYIRFRKIGEMGGGKTIAIALPEGKELPDLPPSGFTSPDDVKGVHVVAEIDMKDKTLFAPGPNPSVYAYVKATVQRNLFRIPLD